MSVDISDLLSQQGLITANIRLPVKIPLKSQTIVLPGYKYKKLAVVNIKKDQSSEAQEPCLVLLSLQ